MREPKLRDGLLFAKVTQRGEGGGASGAEAGPQASHSPLSAGARLPGTPLPVWPPHWPPAGARDTEVALCPCPAHIPRVPGSGAWFWDPRDLALGPPCGLCPGSATVPRRGALVCLGPLGHSRHGPPNQVHPLLLQSLPCRRLSPPSIKTQTPNDLRNCQPTTRCPGAVLPTAPLSALWLTQGCVVTLLLPPAHPSSSLTKPQPSQPPARRRVTVTSTRKPPRMPQGWMRSTSGLPSQLCCHRPAVLQGGRLLPTPAHVGRPLQAWPEQSQPLQRGN